ncbi:MAG: hypothetical protein GDA48_14845 [Hormoscilla sp. GM102CHS1]|nr:hypothetical protein [Hormoscilla sp. GM102CHS1]
MVAEPLTVKENGLRFSGPNSKNPCWQGDLNSVAFDEQGIKTKLLNLDKPCYFLRVKGRMGITNDGYLGAVADADNGKTSSVETLTAVPPLLPQQLGDPSFLDFQGVKYANSSEAMANGIASEELAIALSKERILSSFGAAGLVPDRVEAAIHRIQEAVPYGPYAFNLIHSPAEAAIERRGVELYLKYGITTVEASAFLDLTPNIVRYRLAGNIS